MNETAIYYSLLVCLFFFHPIVYFILFPDGKSVYGRHAKPGGLKLPNKIAWIVMELPAPITILVVSLFEKVNVGALALLSIWEIHYIHRAFIYPFWISKGAPMPLWIAVVGSSFNFVNGYLNGRWLTYFGPNYDVFWLYDLRFIIGSVMFFTGMAINIHSDRVLAKLRPPGDKGYYIPKGGFFRWVSCPNYFGEIVEWFGWAIATWSLPGLLFAFCTAVTLAPRALNHHHWYRRKFDDYPKKRRALIPYLW